MSLFSKLGHWVGDRWGDGPSVSGLKSSIKGTAKLGGTIAPVVGAFNPLLGAGLAAAGSAARGKSLADIVKDAAITGGSGYLLNHAGDVLGKAKGFFSGGDDAASAIGGDVAGVGAAAAPSTVSLGGISMPTPTATALPSAAKAASAASSSNTPGFFSAAVNYAKHNPKDLAIGAGYAANAVMQNGAQSAANRLNERQIALQEQEYADEKKREDDKQARLDPVRALLAQWLAQRMGVPGAAQG